MKLAKLLPTVIAAAVLLAACNNSTPTPSENQTSDNQAAAAVMPADEQQSPYPSYEGVEDTAEAPETPEIKLLSNGTILPSSGNMDLLFSSSGYAGARVRVRKIFTSNILQFLQFDDYEARYNLYKVAKVVADTNLVLGSTSAPHIRAVRNYAISLDELIKPEPGAIYHVEIRGTEPLVEEDFWDSDTYFGDYDTYDLNFVYNATETMEANIPYIMAVPDESWGKGVSLVGSTLVFGGENVTINKAVPTTIETDHFMFIGTYTGATGLENVYILNAAGTSFARGLSEVNPFNAYIKPQSGVTVGANINISFGDDFVTSIKEVDANYGSNDNVYDLQGRTVSTNGLRALPKGLYIMNGKKVVK